MLRLPSALTTVCLAALALSTPGASQAAAGSCPGPALQWIEKPTTAFMAYVDAAYDEARGVAVVFDGSQTWEWDGSRWVRRVTETQPGPVTAGGVYFYTRRVTSLAYDSTRRRTMMVVGDSATPYQAWEWDGNDWTPLAAPPDLAPEIAYDAARQRTMLVASDGGTYEWTGTSWQQLTLGATPPGNGPLAYDAARQRIIMVTAGSTWEWDGVLWTPRMPATGPAGFGRLVYDRARGRVVAVEDNVYRSSVSAWEWDGTSWTLSTPVVAPPQIQAAVVWYDPVLQRTNLYGGFEPGFYTATPSREMWEWDGTSWSFRGELAPPPVFHHPMTYDPLRDRIVAVTGDTWEFDGHEWMVAAAGGPPNPGRAAMAWDPVGERTLFFGSGQTWSWDGTLWAALGPSAGSPPGRVDHAMACDEARQRVIMFGGSPFGRPFAPETWEWDGTAWTALAPATVPTVNADAAMAYDAVRQRVVMYGLRYGAPGSSGPVGETWEWNGSDWIRRTPAMTPPPMSGHAMAYDVARQRTVLYGGLTDYYGYPGAHSCWEWDGTDWTQVESTPATTRTGHAIAYHARLGRVVLYGGFFLSWDTFYVYGETRPACVRNYGTACAIGGGPGEELLLSAFGTPSVGNRSFQLELAQSPPAMPAAALISLGSGSAALPGGCTFLLDPVTTFATLAAPASGGGVARLPLPIPFLPFLTGVTLYGQGVALDVTTSGAALSAGLRLTLGE